jgi:hypothetical protein
MAEDLTGSIGEPFPALPQALLDAPSGHQAKVRAKLKIGRKNPQNSAERAGFEPAAGF